MSSIIERVARKRARLQTILGAWLERPHWIRRADGLRGQPVCLLACYVPSTGLQASTLALARGWHGQGFKVVVVAASDEPSTVRHDLDEAPFITGLLLRKNRGYDFGSWSAGLRWTDGIRDASLLALANDSVIGPLDNFDAMLDRVHASDKDIVGVTDSFERLHHVQSYLVFYKPHAIYSAAFDAFWKRRPVGDRTETILDFELRLMFDMLLAGLTVDILFRANRDDPVNPTLVQWRRLVEEGFPFVKVQLLRENPFMADLDAWPAFLEQHGVDPSRVAQALGAAFPASAAARALATDAA